MSKATKRKYVTQEVLDDFILPTEHQRIVKVVASRGNNLHEVETEHGEKFLASMPTKFRKNVWIKRDNFIIVDPIEEGDKVKAEIAHILYKEQIKHIQHEGAWPAGFCLNERVSGDSMIPDDMLPPSDTDSESDCPAAVQNPNRPPHTEQQSDTDTDSEDDT